MLTKLQYQQLASTLGIEPATIMAVAEVEAPRGGFDEQGRLTILFEPHIFWKELRRRNIDPAVLKAQHPDLLSPIWDKKLYGKFSAQWNKMERAKTINEDAALCSASYGAFQIMGFNHRLCGFDSVKNFVQELQKGELHQLQVFCNFIKSKFLDDELRNKDWSGFALSYNGKGYKLNRYDMKLRKAYQKYSIQN